MIDSFRGFYEFLSNFYRILIIYENIEYPTLEHAFVASKTLDIKKRIYVATKIYDPGKAKRFGREKIILRENWANIQDDIMEKLLRIKFSDVKLAELLINTYPKELIEGNWWGDEYWGVCKGIGENRLGKLLMKIRNELILYKSRSCEDCVDYKESAVDSKWKIYCEAYDMENKLSFAHEIRNPKEAMLCKFYDDESWVK